METRSKYYARVGNRLPSPRVRTDVNERTSDADAIAAAIANHWAMFPESFPRILFSPHRHKVVQIVVYMLLAAVLATNLYKFQIIEATQNAGLPYPIFPFQVNSKTAMPSKTPHHELAGHLGIALALLAVSVVIVGLVPGWNMSYATWVALHVTRDVLLCVFSIFVLRNGFHLGTKPVYMAVYFNFTPLLVMWATTFAWARTFGSRSKWVGAYGDVIFLAALTSAPAFEWVYYLVSRYYY